MEDLELLRLDNQAESTPQYWPLFFSDPQVLEEEHPSYIGYVKKTAPGILKVTDITEDENIFYDKSGTLEAALREDCRKIIRKIMTN